ncbi:MAG TPA: alpha/beta fold hydrolase [Mycobacteriales bacterium]|jgi:pimeloyl-ACP methyl ester carboxylesterase/predicted glycosyltransferase|nr:alpha/beta fold hydrolase [Mycobacteriales bacterium]
MRARLPDRSGAVVRDGIASAYDVYGDEHAATVLLMPTWAIAHAQHWKFQVPVLARRHRVITMDGRGNGRSDRPRDPAAYTTDEYVADALAVLDETGTQRAVVLGVSLGGVRTARFAAQHPDRTLGAVMIGAAFHDLDPDRLRDYLAPFDAVLDDDEGWALYNEHAWRRDWRKFAEFFWGEIFVEPHSTKAFEDAVGWQLETDAETIIASAYAPPIHASREELVADLQRITCPTLVIHGTDDHISPAGIGPALADITGADLLQIAGGGHCPQVRDPIVVNRALLDFIDRVAPAGQREPRRATWTHALHRPRRVLYLSSPIGLGHARRDLAIARELRQLRGEVQVDWVAEHPVTTFLETADERIHPASAYLTSESAHIESESHEHDLNAFQAIRRMDEILVANFSVVQDLVDTGDYDLVVGDESWDLDYFWHENPELKRTAYVWMTDFVGWLPMPDGGEHERMLTADYNAEMIEHIERFGRVRDRAIFVGDPDDIVLDDFGPGLPAIREWTERHYDFSGYITGFDAAALRDRAALRRRLGHPVDAPLVVVTVGGSGVGTALLRKVVDAFPRMRKEVDGLRMLVVAGPRVDVSALPAHDGVDIRGYVADLPQHLAACDAAIVQGGLTTTMELVATATPFLYFPLGNHFEQQRHVRHRLDRHRAGRCLDYAQTDADDIAAGLVEQLNSTCDYLPVPTDGAARAAAMLAELL